MGYCYNAGLSLAKGKYFMLVDHCLWFPPNTLEAIYNFHEENPGSFTYNLERRGKNKEIRHLLTKQYFETPYLWV